MKLEVAYDKHQVSFKPLPFLLPTPLPMLAPVPPHKQVPYHACTSSKGELLMLHAWGMHVCPLNECPR